jgi:hypothetical protein
MKDLKHNPSFEYRVTYAEIPSHFPDHSRTDDGRSRLNDDLAKIAPKPPKGEAWQLAGSVAVGNVVFYHWEREARPQQA